jgi:hypothetical protein
MRQRVAAKVMLQALDEVLAYRTSTVERAARRLRTRRLWGPRFTKTAAAALSATFMRMYGCSIHGVRWGLQGGEFNRRMEALEKR